MSEDWLRTLSETLKDHETPAPEGLWEEIDARLFPQKKRQVWPVIFRWAATVVSVAGFPFYLNSVFPVSPVAWALPENTTQGSEIAAVFEPKVELEERQVAPLSVSEPEVRTLAPEALVGLGAQVHALSVPLPAVRVEPLMKEEKPRTVALRFSLYSAQSGTDLTQNVGGFARVSGNPMSFTGISPEMDQVIEGNREQEVRTDIHHDIPLTFGLQVAVPLKERWRLNTGISYTRMGSSSYSGTAGYAVSTRQEVHYVGLPLQLQYRLVSGKRAQLYGSGGVLLEKAVASQVRHRYIVDYQVSSESKERLPEHPLRWSAHLGIGMEAKVLPSVDLYFEPHFRYNFKDQSCITTVHEVRPVQAGLKLGLRYNLP